MAVQRASRRIGRGASVLQQRVDVVSGEALPSTEERQLDDEAGAANDAAELLDEAGDRLHRPARREHVVVDQHARSLRDQVGMELERVLAVLELVRRAYRLRRQLARPARGDE